MIREIAMHDLYCCLLPQCEALRTCRSGFPIATLLHFCSALLSRYRRQMNKFGKMKVRCQIYSHCLG